MILMDRIELNPRVCNGKPERETTGSHLKFNLLELVDCLYREILFVLSCTVF